MNRRHHRCIASEYLVHRATTRVNLILPDEPTVPFLIASDELGKRAAKIVESNEPTDHWREPSVHLVVEFKQDRDAPRSTQ
jgi:hypothetical protein